MMEEKNDSQMNGERKDVCLKGGAGSPIKRSGRKAAMRRLIMGTLAVLGILCFTLGLTACGEIFDFFAHTHDYQVEEVVPPTCANVGYTRYTCSCGDSYIDNYKQPLEHTKSGNGVNVPVTCTTDGGVKYFCEVCGNEFFDPQTIVFAPGHQLETIPGVPATCTSSGLSDKIQCRVCGQVVQEQTYINELGHIDQNGDDICERCSVLMSSDYVEISSASDLMGIASNLRGKYILAQDISLSGVNWNSLGTESEPFTGILNGNGHSIRDISRSEGGALFRYNAGKIINVKLDGVSLSLNNNSGEVAGFAVYNRGSISGCTISGLRVSYTVNQSKETEYPSYDGGSVGGSACFGGFAARNEGTIENCTIEGGYNVVCAVSSYFKLNPAFFFLDAGYKFTVNVTFIFGGFAGTNRGNIVGCTATSVGTISLTASATSANSHGTAYTNSTCHVGTVAGENTSSVKTCSVQRPVVSRSCGENCTLNVQENES